MNFIAPNHVHNSKIILLNSKEKAFRKRTGKIPNAIHMLSEILRMISFQLLNIPDMRKISLYLHQLNLRKDLLLVVSLVARRKATRQKVGPHTEVKEL